MNNESLPHGLSGSQPLLVDCHVHLHPDFDLARALDAAKAHMTRAYSGSTGVLMLTEVPGVGRFEEMHGQIGTWTLSPTLESCAVIARHLSGFAIVVIAGHQIVTREKIEVLMLGATTPVPSFRPLTETLEHVVDVGAVAVLPFGFGKWTGERRQIIADLAARPPKRNIYLADTGIRREGSPRSSVFQSAETAGWTVLAGTDPLPLTGQVEAVGRYGCVLSGPIDLSHPYADLVSKLSALMSSPDTYGSLQPTLDFVRQQLVMQWRKRVG